ncbi:hypothetical protein AGIG_G4921 [Arapaima gigas]
MIDWQSHQKFGWRAKPFRLKTVLPSNRWRKYIPFMKAQLGRDKVDGATVHENGPGSLEGVADGRGRIEVSEDYSRFQRNVRTSQSGIGRAACREGLHLTLPVDPSLHLPTPLSLWPHLICQCC